MTNPGKGAQRSVDDCIRMGSWNIKEIADCSKELVQATNIMTTRLEQAIDRLTKAFAKTPPVDKGDLPF